MAREAGFSPAVARRTRKAGLGESKLQAGRLPPVLYRRAFASLRQGRCVSRRTRGAAAATASGDIGTVRYAPAAHGSAKSE